LANADGSDPRPLATVQGFALYPRFSLDGQRIRFTLSEQNRVASAIWEVRADGKDLHPLLPGCVILPQNAVAIARLQLQLH
jgi:hypothetical protein